MTYNVIIPELHVPEMFLGESLLLYTDVDYNWLDSGYCGDQLYCLGWDVHVCVGGMGVGERWGSQRTFPSHGLSNDLIKWLLVCIASKRGGLGAYQNSLTPPPFFSLKCI